MACPPEMQRLQHWAVELGLPQRVFSCEQGPFMTSNFALAINAAAQGSDNLGQYLRPVDAMLVSESGQVRAAATLAAECLFVTYTSALEPALEQVLRPTRAAAPGTARAVLMSFSFISFIHPALPPAGAAAVRAGGRPCAGSAACAAAAGGPGPFSRGNPGAHVLCHPASRPHSPWLPSPGAERCRPEGSPAPHQPRCGSLHPLLQWLYLIWQTAGFTLLPQHT
jgi:hypothetical protein